MELKDQIKNDVYDVLKNDISIEDVIVEYPKDRTLGDYAVPCFVFAKIFRNSPINIANEIKSKLDQSKYEKIEVVSGYLNFFVKKEELTKYVLEKIESEKENYGYSNIGFGKTAIIDYSAPNIAKPFGVGHLRSTAIGQAIKNILEKTGYETVGINHLGDWGTQFGKMICAYKKWGNEEAIRNEPIKELLKLYIKFHEEAENDKHLEEEGRAYFKALEEGDDEALKLWKWFRDESLKEFQKTYDLLGIDKFDSYNGESFYLDKMEPVIEELKEKGLLKKDQGAYVVELEDMPPALIMKKDGATLYITRDLAAAFYRKKTYDFDEAVYVIGNEQSLHLKQLKAVISKMGYDFANNMHHVNFGMILQNGKKMATRKGRTVMLHDVLLEAKEMAKKHVKNVDEKDVEEVSRQIGIGAVIFNDLKNYRISDIEFNLEDVLKFEGETGPYIQYTHARINSLLNESTDLEIDYNDIEFNQLIWNLVFKLYEFNDIIVKAKLGYDPSLIAKYAIDLAQDFNKFYGNYKINDGNNNEKAFKLRVSKSVAIVLKESLRLLNIDAPNKM